MKAKTYSMLPIRDSHMQTRFYYNFFCFFYIYGLFALIKAQNIQESDFNDFSVIQYKILKTLKQDTITFQN